MKPKSDLDRFNDCIDYIKRNINQSLATHLTSTVGAHKDAIGSELSLGTRWDGLSKNRDANTRQRHALRSLLLCQRVYYSKLWPYLMGNQATPTYNDRIKTDWKKQSRRFWEKKSEAQIRDGIRMFVATSNNLDDLARVAKESGGPPGGETYAPSLAATRTTFTGPKTETCYDAVMLWLFKSGLVSFRWLLKHRGANTKDTLNAAFGPGKQLWSGKFGSGQSLGKIAKGHIVHMFEHENSWRGHWMVSTGKGGASGVNNNDEADVERLYSSKLTIDGQFLDFEGGTAIEIDPLQIPGRN